MPQIKKTIAFVVGLVTIALVLSGVFSVAMYFAFGLAVAIIIGIIEYGTFASRIKKEVFEKHGVDQTPSPFFYLPVAVVNIFFWGYGLTVHLLSAIDVMFTRVHE